MLMRTDPFRTLDRLTQQVFGGQQGTWWSPAAMPMEAYRVRAATDLDNTPMAKAFLRAG